VGKVNSKNLPDSSTGPVKKRIPPVSHHGNAMQLPWRQKEHHGNTMEVDLILVVKRVRTFFLRPHDHHQRLLESWTWFPLAGIIFVIFF